jgi:hypothetical protein
VNRPQSSMLWDSMHSPLKIFAFPLKLRDPKKLYSRTSWSHLPKHWAKFKFLGRPQKKSSYLVQPGDLIQFAKDGSLNRFKVQSWLWQKPLPSHLMTLKRKKDIWAWRSQSYINKAFNSWEQNYDSGHSAVILHTSRFEDLNSKDRVQESFLRWAIL